MYIPYIRWLTTTLTRLSPGCAQALEQHHDAETAQRISGGTADG